MISLLLILKRFWTVIVHGWDDREFRGLTLVLAGWVTLGTLIYSISEGWGAIEALYFCVMTLTTIGYGDYTPTGSTMQLYTVIYSVLGIGFFVAFNARIVQIAFATRRRDDADEA
jgi:voltage-gated potassium channel